MGVVSKRLNKRLTYVNQQSDQTFDYSELIFQFGDQSSQAGDYFAAR